MLDNRTTLRAFIISSPRHRRAGERHLPPDGIGNLSIPETAPVGRGHVPAGVGTTKYVQTCSCLPSAASRSAGTCPRPTEAVSFIVVRFSHVDCEEHSDVAISCRNDRLRTNLPGDWRKTAAYGYDARFLTPPRLIRLSTLLPRLAASRSQNIPTTPTVSGRRKSLTA